ncbi:MAG: hypothetical protein Q9185_003323 [Variospora sp. 1 TL-2023]
MADVRSMLRNERATRRITHPHLTYSTTGTLACLVCHVQIKTEALWNKHLNSTLHATNASKSREEASGKKNNSKKRKADDDESSDEEDTRKRAKGVDNVPPPNGFVSEKNKKQQTLNDPLPPPIADQKPESTFAPPKTLGSTTTDIPSRPHPHEPPRPPPVSAPAVNEDEWAAFQRDVASPPPEPSALTAAADISAAPLTAAELAAQSREEASRQAKERLEAELEGEKEDAARQLEDEFEDMAELEDRVRRLREKREALRVREVVEEEGQKEKPPDEEVEVGQGVDEGGSEDDDDEVDDGWAGWRR